MKVSEVAYAAQRAYGVEDKLLSAENWVNDRYRQLAERYQLRHLRKIKEVAIRSTISAGTATPVTGSAIITGDADALAAWAALGTDIVNCFISPPAAQRWYEVVEFLPGQGLKIGLPYIEAVGDDEEHSYSLIQRYTDLPTDLQRLGQVTFMRGLTTVTPVSQYDIDLADPGRLINSWPRKCAEAPVHPITGVRRLEVYPPPSEEMEVLRLYYWAQPRVYEWDEELPSVLPKQVLVMGVQIDLLSHLWAQAVAAKDTEGAGHYRNEAARLTTKWEGQEVFMALKTEAGGRENSAHVNLDGRVWSDMADSNVDPVISGYDEFRYFGRA